MEKRGDFPSKLLLGSFIELVQAVAEQNVVTKFEENRERDKVKRRP